MRKRAGIALMVLGLVLIGSALGLIAQNGSEERESGEAVVQAEKEVREQILLQEERLQKESFFPEPQPEDVPGELPVQEVEGESYIGMLGLPALEMELPVMDSWSYKKLRRAPCRQYGTTARDLVIAGHNYRRHFGRLKTLIPGDLVTFTDMDGNLTTYEVGTVETVHPVDGEKILHPEWDLILYTCTHSGRSRLLVGCRTLES